jgi:hypothetical protein
MPYVKNHKLLIRDYSDVAIYVPAYEVPLAKLKHRAPRKGAKLTSMDKAIEEIPFGANTQPALAVRDISSINDEWNRVNRIYDFAIVSKVYPDIAEFTAAVEKALVTFSTAKQVKPEISTKYKSMGLTSEQAESCIAHGLPTPDSVRSADLAVLARALGVPVDKAQAIRAKWNGEEAAVLTPVPALVGANDDE